MKLNQISEAIFDSYTNRDALFGAAALTLMATRINLVAAALLVVSRLTPLALKHFGCKDQQITQYDPIIFGVATVGAVAFAAFSLHASAAALVSLAALGAVRLVAQYHHLHT